MSISKTFFNSFSELKKLKSLAFIAMLLALRIVLGMFANATLPLFGNNIKLSPAFLPIAAAGAMFGPIPAGLIGAFGDIFSFILSPGAGGYFPGFTINGLLTGLIYGFAFYKNRVKLSRVVAAWIVNLVIVETFLAAYWLFILYGAGETPYEVYLYARLIRAAVLCVPEILLIFAIGKLTTTLEKSVNVI